MSDLHLQPYGPVLRPRHVPPHDVLVLAGDVTSPPRHSVMQARALSDRPSIVVCGNHEFYEQEISSAVIEGQREAMLGDGRVHLLENRQVIIDGVRFLGTCLWTDYDLYGGSRRERVMDDCGRCMNDHRVIWRQRAEGRHALFRPEHARERHLRARAFLVRSLDIPFDGPTVVVTHHAPHPRSVHTRFEGDPVTPGFVSDLEEMIERYKPALWLHGHTHDRHDYTVAGTRVVCNPMGYTREDTGFDPSLIIEV